MPMPTNQLQLDLQLLKVCEEGESETCAIDLLKKGANPGAVSDWRRGGVSAFHAMCAEGWKAAVVEALPRLKNLHLRTVGELDTPLHWAAQCGHTDICLLLMERGASILLKNKYNLTPLTIVDDDKQATVKAMTDFAETLKARKKSAPSEVQTPEEFRQKPSPAKQRKLDLQLLQVCREGEAEKSAVQLLEKGADPNVTNVDGVTAFHSMCAEGWKAAVEVALPRIRSLTMRTPGELDTPLHWAAQCGQTEICLLLLSRGASVHAKNKADLTPRTIIDDDKAETLEAIDAYLASRKAAAIINGAEALKVKPL